MAKASGLTAQPCGGGRRGSVCLNWLFRPRVICNHRIRSCYSLGSRSGFGGRVQAYSVARQARGVDQVAKRIKILNVEARI
jgi:hypothetical protein